MITGLLISWDLLPSSHKISYNQDVRPIFNQHCLPCHGGIKQSGGFSLLFEEEALDTTDSGVPAIIPGNAQESELYKRLIHQDPEYRMPLDHAPLEEKDINIIRSWIDQGAQWETHWAYHSPKTILPPQQTSPWVQNPIDQFTLQQMTQRGLKPSDLESPEKLTRRLHFDLVGLPPASDSPNPFNTVPSDSTYESLVDSLLSSPAFGEKWATMWLDLARYADSKGYEKDLYRSIWKYRDWVIQALNNNMPFDQFTVEQLAGDLLPEPTQAQLLATAFHRNTMANDEGGTDNEEYRNYAVIERVGTTFEVWQGTTMACVQCHSHPYDPIKQEEFYQFMSFYNNTADRDIYHEGPNLFTYPPKRKKEVQQIVHWVAEHTIPEIKQITEPNLYKKKEQILQTLGYRKIQAEYFEESSRFIELVNPGQDVIFQVQDDSWIMYEQIDISSVTHISYRYASPYTGFIEFRLDSINGKLLNRFHVTPTSSPQDKERWKSWKTRKVPLIQAEGIHDIYFVFRKDQHQTQDLFRLDWMFLHEKEPLYQRFDANLLHKLVQLDTLPAIPTPIMQELPSHKRRPTHIFERGSWLNPGKTVQPGVPSEFNIAQTSISNRLDMAKWLVSPDNPLTARVIVNRIWEQIFGKGIVSSLEDFGTQGEAPTHIQLLDWLALEFVKSGWDMKHLIKLMVMSATYRQTAATTPEKLEMDPDNTWLSRGPRIRMSAEQLRDQALAVSGLLSDKMYGPGVFPPIPEGVSINPFIGNWDISKGEDKYRRAIYTFVHRTSPYPSQIIFDASDRTTCLSRRIRTNTPLQALSLLNDLVFMDAARELGKKWVLEQQMSIAERISSGYQHISFSAIDNQKLQLLLELYHISLKQYQEDPNLICEMFPTEEAPSSDLAAWTVVANAMLNLDENITK